MASSSFLFPERPGTSAIRRPQRAHPTAYSSPIQVRNGCHAPKNVVTTTPGASSPHPVPFPRLLHMHKQDLTYSEHPRGASGAGSRRDKASLPSLDTSPNDSGCTSRSSITSLASISSTLVHYCNFHQVSKHGFCQVSQTG
ncbi:hypothetical protein M758_1G263000 [Ceratodon purpureus]|nr:hypothetical protein M758_1G263000 [Ceratodon purpureus]